MSPRATKIGPRLHEQPKPYFTLQNINKTNVFRRLCDRFSTCTEQSNLWKYLIMELRTRSQNAALKFFKENTSVHKASQKYQKGVDAILAPDCLRPRTLAKTLIKAERRTRVVISAKPVSRNELETAILQFTAKHGSPDTALVHVNGREAPIEEARRLADDGELTTTRLNKLLQLMRDCVGLWDALDVKMSKQWAARQLGKPEPDPRYRMTSLGWSIPLKVALAEPAEGNVPNYA